MYGKPSWRGDTFAVRRADRQGRPGSEREPGSAATSRHGACEWVSRHTGGCFPQRKAEFIPLPSHPSSQEPALPRVCARRSLYLIATDRLTVADLFAKATDDRGPFGDHLRYHLFRMHDKAELIKGMCSAMKQNTCDDEAIFFRLRGAGLVKRAGMKVEPRCQLYAKFFDEHLRCS